eukprot:1542125-Pyramimonas_sp.AAC.1
MLRERKSSFALPRTVVGKAWNVRSAQVSMSKCATKNYTTMGELQGRDQQVYLAKLAEQVRALRRFSLFGSRVQPSQPGAPFGICTFLIE